MSGTKEQTQTGAADGTSLTFTFDIGSIENITVFVDDNAGGAPASYDITYETHAGSGNFMTHYEATGNTAYRHDLGPDGTKAQLTVTNTSGGAADHRVRVVYTAD